jgi:hypothetical protein
LIYGIIAAFSAVLFIIFARENPPTHAGPAGEQVHALMLDGIKHAFEIETILMYLVISFIGLGIFNGVTTWVESIIRPRGFTPTDAGTLGALMLVGGIIGAVVIPASPTTAQAPAFHVPGHCSGNPRIVGIDLRYQHLAAFRFGIFYGVLPGERESDRHAVRHRGDLSHTGRDF